MFRRMARVALAIALGVAASVAPGACAADVSIFLLNFGETGYSGDGVRVWQTFDLASATGTTVGDPVGVSSQILADIAGSMAMGLRFSVDVSAGSDASTSLQSPAETLFAGNPYEWFDPTAPAQRETFGLKNGSGVWTYVLDGFATDDTVNVAFVLGRTGAGDRATTISQTDNGDVLNDGQVDSDGGPQYPAVGNLTGATRYRFSIAATGSGWGCVPNAIRVEARHAPTPGQATCAIVAPAAGAILYADDALSVIVSAAAGGTDISAVTLYANQAPYLTDAAVPYVFPVGYPGEGRLDLSAVATAVNGNAATSMIAVTVTSAFARAWTRHTLDTGLPGADGVRAADVDGDGDLDLVVSWEEAGVVRIYRNPGASRAALTTAWPRVTFSNGLAAVEDANLTDVDGDGRLDIVAATEAGNRNLVIYWAPPPGQDYWTDANWTRMDLTPAAGQEWMFSRTMDVNGDGRTDLIAGAKNSGATVSWIEAPPTPRVAAGWTRHTMTAAGWIMSLEFEDMDGDGDTDVLISDRRGGGAAQAARWLEHPGASSPNLRLVWTSHTIAGLGEEVMFLDVVDIDADGLRDVVIPVLEEAHTPNDWLLARRLDASGLHWSVTRRAFPAGTGEAKSFRAADINRDGRTDLVAAFGDAISPAEGVCWLAHDGDSIGGAWRAWPVSGGAGEKFDLVQALDLDGDGDLDLITTDEDENKDSNGLGLLVYENPSVKDTDGDGFTEQQEFAAGTDPLDATKRLVIESIAVSPAGLVTVEWNSDQNGAAPPRRYWVAITEGAPSNGAAWTELRGGIGAAGSKTATQDDSASATAPRRLYRIEIDDSP